MRSNSILSARILSFKYAFNGIWITLKSQKNAWIHLFITIMVMIAGFYFGITAKEWCWIVLAISSVWTAEALNTAFEFLTDVASPEFHPLAAKGKDVSAGAVLISAIGAAIIGLIIFIPHIMH